MFNHQQIKGICMIKKMMMFLCLGFVVGQELAARPVVFGLEGHGAYGSVGYYRQIDVSDKVIKSIAAVTMALVAYKTGSYLHSRESNLSKMDRLQNLWQKLSPSMKFNTVYDMQQFLVQFHALRALVLSSYKEMNARYNSWIKPWNWSAAMQTSFQKAELLAILFDFRDIICAWNSLQSEQEVVQLVKKKLQGSYAYPLIKTASDLEHDIAVLKSLQLSVGFEVVLKDLLEEVLEVILSSDDYLQERRAKNIEDLQRRQAQAAENTAWAIRSSRW